MTKEQTDKLYNKLTNTKIKKKVSEDASSWLYNIDIFRKKSSISITLISNEECSISNKKYSIKENKGKEIIDMVKEFTDK